MKISPRLSAQLEAVFESNTLDWNDLILSIDEDPETFLEYSNLSFIDFSHTDMKNMSISGSYIDGIKVKKGNLSEIQIASAASAENLIWIEPDECTILQSPAPQDSNVIIVDFQRVIKEDDDRRNQPIYERRIAALHLEDAPIVDNLNNKKHPTKTEPTAVSELLVIASVSTDIGVIDFLMEPNYVRVYSPSLHGGVLQLGNNHFRLDSIEGLSNTFTIVGLTLLNLCALLQRARAFPTK